jgi:hypothetical protein
MRSLEVSALVVEVVVLLVAEFSFFRLQGVPRRASLDYGCRVLVVAGASLHQFGQGKNLRAKWVATADQPGHHVHHLFDDLVGERHQLLVLLAPLRHFVVQGVLRSSVRGEC